MVRLPLPTSVLLSERQMQCIELEELLCSANKQEWKIKLLERPLEEFSMRGGSVKIRDTIVQFRNYQKDLSLLLAKLKPSVEKHVEFEKLVQDFHRWISEQRLLFEFYRTQAFKEYENFQSSLDDLDETERALKSLKICKVSFETKDTDCWFSNANEIQRALVISCPENFKLLEATNVQIKDLKEQFGQAKDQLHHEIWTNSWIAAMVKFDGTGSKLSAKRSLVCLRRKS